MYQSFRPVLFGSIPYNPRLPSKYAVVNVPMRSESGFSKHIRPAWHDVIRVAMVERIHHIHWDRIQ